MGFLAHVVQQVGPSARLHMKYEERGRYSFYQGVNPGGPWIEWLKSQRRWASGGALEMALVGVRGRGASVAYSMQSPPAPSLEPLPTLAAVANP